MGYGIIPIDDDGRAVLGLWNDATGQVIPLHVGATVTGADGKSYAKLDVNASVTSNPPSGAVSTLNSTTTLLAGNSVYTGSSESGLAYGSLSVEAYSDQASAANGLVVQQSQDGTYWDTKNTYSVAAATPFQVTVNIVAPYFQVKYTNGAVAQGTFRLQTVKLVAPSPSAGAANQRVNAQSGDFADGSLVAIGTTTQTKATDGSATSWSAIQLLKGILDKLLNSVAVTGTFWQATQPVSIAGNQAVNTQQIAGTTTSVNAGSVDAGTQRVNQGSAATGTKTNVASSAASVTILAANTGRKGAIIYNDSAQVLYLDLSGGTASSSSYSVQVPAQGYFELPGPAVYNGLITGIWASANGNARVTEFS